MMLETDELARRYQAVKTRLVAACLECKRDPQSVRLIAVSKTHPVEQIIALASLGHQDFGENYAQELATKRKDLDQQAASSTKVRISYIGTLQSNKIATLVAAADEIQTLCDARHARLIAKAAREQGRAPYPVWINVNAAQESNKSGLALDEAAVLAETITQNYPELDLQGLMAIPPPLTDLHTHDDADAPPPLYRALATTARHIGRGELSLGMSDDLRLAVLAGSSCIRIGTAIFGTR